MPAFPIHTLFGYLAGASLRESGHPLSEAIQEEQWLFLQASVTGADFPLMPYFACDQCGNPTRFPGPHLANSVNPSDSFNGETCPACHSGNYRPFVVDVPGWGTIDRHTLETRHYRRTHLVLGEYHGFGVHPDIPAGPEEQPFPSQVCERLVSVWRSVHRIGNRDGKRAKRLAFVAGWFAHVISDALFKGIYRSHRYGPKNHTLEEIHAYARQNGFLDAFSTGRRIYERLMGEAAEQVAQGWRTL